MSRLPMRTRKLIGSALLVAFIVFYALMAALIGSAQLRGASVLAQTIFYAVAGFAWTIPAGALIWWMQRPE